MNWYDVDPWNATRCDTNSLHLGVGPSATAYASSLTTNCCQAEAGPPPKKEENPPKDYGNGLRANFVYKPLDTVYLGKVRGDDLYLILSDWDGNISTTLRTITIKYGFLEKHLYFRIKDNITNARTRKLENEKIKKEADKRKVFRLGSKNLYIKDVIFNDPATIIFWSDDTKTVVKTQDEIYDPEKGLAMAIVKKVFGNKGNYNNEIKRLLGGIHENDHG